jgi:hypothetical protein
MATLTTAPADGGEAMALDIATGVIALTAGPDGAGPASLAWPLGLSAWMRRHGAGPAEVVATIGALRSAVLEVGGLDAASEPVPLPVADPTVKAVNGAIYLAGLIRRAAAAREVPVDSVIDAAVARIGHGIALTA